MQRPADRAPQGALEAGLDVAEAVGWTEAEEGPAEEEGRSEESGVAALAPYLA